MFTNSQLQEDAILHTLHIDTACIQLIINDILLAVIRPHRGTNDPQVAKPVQWYRHIITLH